MRRWAVPVLVILQAWFLAGCAGLPSSSRVVSGKAVSSDEAPEPLTVMPDGPLPGDDPRGIVTGFLRAQMWQPNGYFLARSFLTPTGSREWKPGASATVFDESAQMQVTRPDVHTVRVEIPVVAEMSVDGHMTRRASPQYRRLDFTTTNTPGGWRISAVAPQLGLWLAQDDFTRLYKSVDVYYPSAFGHAMVPDARWLPRQGLTTALARAALSPPPTWLAPAVHFPYPRGTSLEVEAVPVSVKGRATIDLSGQIERASAADRAGAWASLLATVVQAPEVHSVTLASQGSRLEAENLPSDVTSVSDVGYQMPSTPSRAVITRSGNYLRWRDSSDLTAETDRSSSTTDRPPLPAVPVSWRSLAAGPGGRQVAAVSTDGTSLRRWVNGGAVTLSALGTDLVRPQFDSFGYLWCAGRSFANTPDGGGRAAKGTAVMWALQSSEGPQTSPAATLNVPWLGDGLVVAVAPSPEGARVALIVQNDGQRKLVTAAIVRDSSGEPVALGPPREISAVADPSDVTWLDADNLAVLMPTGQGRGPARVALDGAVTPLGYAAGAASLISTRQGNDGLFVATAGGAVLGRRGAGWISYLSDAAVVVPSA